MRAAKELSLNILELGDQNFLKSQNALKLMNLSLE